jgi:hypothetical protein
VAIATIVALLFPSLSHALSGTDRFIVLAQDEVRPNREETTRRSAERRSDAEKRQADFLESRKKERQASGRGYDDDRRNEQQRGRGEEANNLAGARAEKGFASERSLQGHWEKHGTDFGAKNRAEYEKQAIRFLNGPATEGTLEKTRTDGDVIRFNERTDEFGVRRHDGTVRSYFRPDPAEHGKATNLDYFNAQR